MSAGPGRADTLLLLLLPGLLDEVVAAVGSSLPEAATTGAALVLTTPPGPTSSLSLLAPPARPLSRSLPADLVRWLEGRLLLEAAPAVSPTVASSIVISLAGEVLVGDRMDLTGMREALVAAAVAGALCCNPRKSRNDGAGTSRWGELVAPILLSLSSLV